MLGGRKFNKAIFRHPGFNWLVRFEADTLQLAGVKWFGGGRAKVVGN